MIVLKDNYTVTYRVYNLTTDLLCRDFEEKDELKNYLMIVRRRYPEDEFVVYRICTSVAYDKMNW
ncbi:MAG TPA: hypothetical protein DDY71_05210 [Spirochaetia bacterium]|nr:hypothetical protein [Spirochaetia bacterium]